MLEINLKNSKMMKKKQWMWKSTTNVFLEIFGTAQ